MIEQFRGEHFFLSNMKPLKNWIETDRGISVPTTEHAYQAAKFEDLDFHRRVAEARAGEDDLRVVYADGVASKNLAHELEDLYKIPIRADWQVAKTGVMYVVVMQKFVRNPDLAERLLATEDEELVEGNNWGDRFWGVDPVGSNNGENHLGRILMRVRRRLLEERGADEG